MDLPYTHEFTAPNGEKMTSVVLLPNDFKKFCDKLELFEMLDPEPGSTSKQMVDKVRSIQVIHMLQRTNRTKIFFKRWNIKTQFISVIVQGAGDRLLNEATQFV